MKQAKAGKWVSHDAVFWPRALVKKFRVRYTPEAAARIQKLHPQVKREVREGVRQLVETPMAGRPLHFELSDYWSYRVRTYRIIHQINDALLEKGA